MEHERTTDDVNERGVWQRPVLRPLSGAVGARSGASSYKYEGTVGSSPSQYVPAPS